MRNSAPHVLSERPNFPPAQVLLIVGARRKARPTDSNWMGQDRQIITGWEVELLRSKNDKLTLSCLC